MKKFIPPVALLFLLACSAKDGMNSGPTFEAWTVPVEIRVSRAAFSPRPDAGTIELEGLAGEVLSAQVAVRSNRDIERLSASLRDLSSPDGKGSIPAAAGRVRYGGFVPVVETMTLTADPLLEDRSIDVPANLAQPVWITLALPRDARPGRYEGKLELSSSSGQSAAFDLSVEVLPAVLPEPSEWKFMLFMWQDPTAVAKAYGLEVWSEEHWRILERCAANYYAHGIKSITTHIIYDPWNGVRGWGSDQMVEWKYPGEVKAGGADKWEWDFAVFDRYVQMMMDAGIREKIDMYAMVMGPWIIPDAHIRYLDTATGEYRTVRQNVGELLWREAWRAFLPVLRDHLKEKGWFDRAVLGFDEKPKEIMQLIFAFVDSVAPDFRLSQAGGYAGDDKRRGEELVLHMESFQDPIRWAELKPVVERLKQDPHGYATFYTACVPWYPNTFLFSQLRESRLMPWIARRYGFEGYSRWAVDLFPEDVWNRPRFTWSSGDMFFVWPGPEGPLDSMRWELLRQGIQDYEALEIAAGMARRAGRQDLIDKLEQAVDRGSVIDNCGEIPLIEQSRRQVNEVIVELGGA